MTSTIESLILDGFRSGAAVLAAQQTGLLQALEVGGTIEQLAQRTQLEVGVVENLLKLFTVCGWIVGSPESGFRVDNPSKLRALTSGLEDAQLKHETALRHPVAMRTLTSEQLVVVGSGVGPSDPFARAEIVAGLSLVDEIREKMELGASYLELGAGMGTMASAILESFPKVQGTLVERSKGVAQQLAHRLDELKLASRAKVVVSDAASVRFETRFGMVFWSQAFFDSDDRALVLESLPRFLANHGILFIFPFSDGPTQDNDRAQLRQRYFDRASHCGWGCPILSKADLVDAVEATGLLFLREAKVWDHEVVLLFSHRDRNSGLE